jgi:hypothetical protein
MWIDNESIHPYYVDFKKGSKIKAFTEEKITTSYAEDAFSLTKTVYNYYEEYLGQNLVGENKEHYNNAIENQTKAIDQLAEGKPGFYLYHILLAKTEYEKIAVV